MDAASGLLHISDALTLPETLRNTKTLNIALGTQFSLESPPASQHTAGVYSIALQPGQREVHLQYTGKPVSTPDCNWLNQACVMADPSRGLYLDGGSGWYPEIANMLHIFTLKTELPDGWVSISQGEQTPDGWQETHPQNSIYLIAGKFHIYQQPGKYATAMVYLQQDDPTLATQYLQATSEYLDTYSHLLGDYPYKKFATVESFWETGWGMPSFTLLGSRVMRLPFILHSSFPHEILHNWWGNGVYVDATQGNWSEGLTAYLADQRIKQQAGEGVEYRRTALQKYATFAAGGKDFPLEKFRSRHDAATQAIGYGKSMMLFHMLHKQLGDKAFFAGLQSFYRDFKFRAATFDDLLASLKAPADFRKIWVETAGAPHLKLPEHSVQLQGTGYQVQLTLAQTQDGKAFPLDIPIRISFVDGRSSVTQTVHMDSKQQSFTLNVPAKPQTLAVDPDFDLFRLPDPAEVPAALDALYSGSTKTYVLSRKTDEAMQLAWESWLDTLKASDKNLRVQYDDEPLPDTGTVILLGGDNEALQGLLDRAKEPFRLTDAAYTLNSVNYTCGLHTLALALRAGKQNIVLLDASTPDGLDRMLAKLPHYGKYSYVLFNSGTGENVAKGQWQVTDSPLTVEFTEEKSKE